MSSRESSIEVDEPQPKVLADYRAAIDAAEGSPYAYASPFSGYSYGRKTRETDWDEEFSVSSVAEDDEYGYAQGKRRRGSDEEQDADEQEEEWDGGEMEMDMD